MLMYECRHYCGDMKDNHACKVIGHITECADKCECFTDRFGNQPNNLPEGHQAAVALNFLHEL